jgi:hypothetical protein
MSQRSGTIELHFRVVDFYELAHTEVGAYPDPAAFSRQQGQGRAGRPPGGHVVYFSFTAGSWTYTGAFTVKLPVVAEAGIHTVDGTLRYQACDHAACYPPKSLPIQVIFTAK